MEVTIKLRLEEPKREGHQSKLRPRVEFSRGSRDQREVLRLLYGGASNHHASYRTRGGKEEPVDSQATALKYLLDVLAEAVAAADN